MHHTFGTHQANFLCNSCMFNFGIAPCPGWLGSICDLVLAISSNNLLLFIMMHKWLWHNNLHSSPYKAVDFFFYMGV